MTDDDRPDEASSATGKGSEVLSRIPRSVQILWVCIAAFGFIDNVFGSAGASFPWHPIASTSALAWLVFGIIGLAINHLATVGLPGGTNLSFRTLQRAEKAAAKSEVSAEAVREVLSDYSDLMHKWLRSVNLFTEQLKKYGKTDDDVGEILAQFCLGRMEEAKGVIAEQGDRTRFSFWWFVEDEGGLKLLFSDDIRDEDTLNHVFKPGSGLLGQCYVESRLYNVEDAPSSIYFEKIRAQTDYHGLLLVPVRSTTDGPVIGVLSVDREKKEAFDKNASNVAAALADLIAYAMETGLDFEPE
jgi:hypothetical protein